jgi:predicted transcriptional regulator
MDQLSDDEYEFLKRLQESPSHFRAVQKALNLNSTKISRMAKYLKSEGCIIQSESREGRKYGTLPYEITDKGREAIRVYETIRDLRELAAKAHDEWSPVIEGETENAILRCLFDHKEDVQGLSRLRIKSITGLPGAWLSQALNRLQAGKFILKVQDGTFHLTRIGLRRLFSDTSKEISLDDLKDQIKRDTMNLWNEMRALQDKILRIRPIHKSTRELMALSGAHAGVFIAALQTKDGRKFLSWQTPSWRQLEKLGYLETAKT